MLVEPGFLADGLELPKGKIEHPKEIIKIKKAANKLFIIENMLFKFYQKYKKISS